MHGQDQAVASVSREHSHQSTPSSASGSAVQGHAMSRGMGAIMDKLAQLEGKDILLQRKSHEIAQMFPFLASSSSLPN